MRHAIGGEQAREAVRRNLLIVRGDALADGAALVVGLLHAEAEERLACTSAGFGALAEHPWFAGAADGAPGSAAEGLDIWDALRRRRLPPPIVPSADLPLDVTDTVEPDDLLPPPVPDEAQPLFAAFGPTRRLGGGGGGGGGGGTPSPCRSRPPSASRRRRLEPAVPPSAAVAAADEPAVSDDEARDPAKRAPRPPPAHNHGPGEFLRSPRPQHLPHRDPSPQLACAG
jgi:hypothetical protein